MSIYSPAALVPDDFDPLPGLADLASVQVTAGAVLPDAQLVAILTPSNADSAKAGDFGADALARLGLESAPGSRVVVPAATGELRVFVSIGQAAHPTPASLRTAAAAVVRASGQRTKVSIVSGPLDLDSAVAAQAITEGVLLANYRYTPLKSSPPRPGLEAVSIEIDDADQGEVAAGIAAGGRAARAAVVARDLTNAPPAYLTATALGVAAQRLGREYGFEVEVVDKAGLIALGAGGILGVNRGSADEPRLLVLRYRPEGASGHLGFVGKGITYDSGGISLKPSGPMHALMKMDMGGAGAVLGAFTGLRDAGVAVEVSGWLAVTDNMPSGSALKLGDVLTTRGGTTVEVLNTDAEGRLVMSDAIVLANEAAVDAIVDIATLTGAAQAALGQAMAAIIGNDQEMIDQVVAAGRQTDEPLWQLPLERSYRAQLDSKVADIANVGGPYAGATTAALFLEHFVAGTPWAHLDIAGTMAVEKDDAWRTAGATGFGARTLLRLAEGFEAPARRG